MRLLHNLSIRHKLIIIILIVTMAVMMFGFSITAYYDIKALRAKMVQNLVVNAKLVAEYCITPIIFEDKPGAKEILKKLQTIPYVKGAYILDSSGRLFASYGIADTTSLYSEIEIISNPSNRFSGKTLYVIQPIYYNHTFYGAVCLRASTRILDAKIRDYLLLIVSLVAGLLLATFLLATKLQGIISKPILDLAEVTRQISIDGDYSVRVYNEGTDEIAALYGSFNAMLQQIQLREAQRDNAERINRRLAKILEGTSDLVAVASPDGKLIYINQAGRKLVGWDDEDTISSKTLKDIHPPESLGVITQEGIPTAIKEGVWKGETQVFGAGNSSIPVSQVLLSHKSEFGKVEYISTIIRDMTVRKQAEDDLKRARNYIRNIINSMPSILIGVDTNGYVTQWNREAERVTGIKASQAERNKLEDVFPQLADEMENVRKAMQSAKTIVDEKRQLLFGDKSRIANVTIYPLITDGLDGVVIRVDDVTERTQIEEMMIQSEKMLSVGGLAAGMAHEINNPLAGILQNVQVLQNRLSNTIPKNEKVAEECGTSIEAIVEYIRRRDVDTMMASIVDSGKRAARIVDNMLSFSRKSTADAVKNDIIALLDKTIELAYHDYDLKKNYDFRRVEIIRQYDSENIEVVCEPSKIQQVLLNILKNGAQAMADKEYADGRPTITIRARSDGESAIIEIEDNGPGMNEATRKRIFEPFFTTKNVGVGTGLGLSVSYFIISDNHGGNLSVDSTEGVGTKFTISLPLNGVRQCVTIA